MRKRKTTAQQRPAARSSQRAGIAEAPLSQTALDSAATFARGHAANHTVGWWNPTPSPETRAYVSNELQRFTAIRFQKENLSNTAVGLWLASLGALLGTSELPFATLGWLAAGIAGVLWSLAYLTLRYFLNRQLRLYRWATWRQAGCDWLLFSWIEGAQLADRDLNTFNNDWHETAPRALPEPEYARENEKSFWRRLGELVWINEVKVAPIDPKLAVYPQFLEQAWLKAAKRGSDSALDERMYKRITLIAFALGFATIVAKTSQYVSQPVRSAAVAVPTPTTPTPKAPAGSAPKPAPIQKRSQ